jgi:hypothetical protein
VRCATAVGFIGVKLGTPQIEEGEVVIMEPADLACRLSETGRMADETFPSQDSREAGGGNATSCCLDVVIVLRCKFIGASGAFLDGRCALALEDQAGGSPDVNFGYIGRRLSVIVCQSVSARSTLKMHHRLPVPLCPIRQF